ncbi:hypothetical protein [Pseudomonas sp. NPDC096950]|uniref:hypothetical protein n=1 Tax=Pseudomonas sp. NPDC096950 TaxID=3364485 RepID=UPI00383B57AA
MTLLSALSASSILDRRDMVAALMKILAKQTEHPNFHKVGLAVSVACVLAAIFYVPVLIEDVFLYRAVVSQRSCCGFVPESWLERPITYLMVDDWTAPVWSVNAAKTQRWLTTDGLVNGETKFWRLLQKEPIENHL